MNITQKTLVYVGHRFNFKGIWPQLVSYFHTNNGYSDKLPNFFTEDVIEKKYESGYITEKEYEQWIYLNNILPLIHNNPPT